MDLFITLIEIVASLAIGIALVYFFPKKERVLHTKKDMATLAKEYGKYEYLVLPLLFVVWPFFSALIGLVVYSLFELLIAFIGPTDVKYYLRVPMGAFMGSSFLVAIIPFGRVATYVYERVLKDRYLEYLVYQEYKHGYDGEAAFNSISKFAIVVSIPFFWLLHDWNAKIYDDHITYDPLLTVSSKDYPYDSVSRIELDTFHDWRFQVFLNDGNKFQLNNFLVCDAPDGEMAAFLSSKTGLKVDTVCNVPKPSN